MKFGQLFKGCRFETVSGSKHIVLEYGVELAGCGQPVNAVELSTGTLKFFNDKSDIYNVMKLCTKEQQYQLNQSVE